MEGLVFAAGGAALSAAVWNSIVVCGTEENGVINYLVSAGLRKEASSINSNCLSFTMEEHAYTQHLLARLIRPPELAAKGHRILYAALSCDLNVI